jgi:hypothetical protein
MVVKVLVLQEVITVAVALDLLEEVVIVAVQDHQVVVEEDKLQSLLCFEYNLVKC